MLFHRPLWAIHAHITSKHLEQNPFQTAFSALFLQFRPQYTLLRSSGGRFGIFIKTAYLAVVKVVLVGFFHRDITKSLTKKLLPIDRNLLFEPF